jgi:diadenosine tetraphosphate (Ap4A) HIT family hydrolase
MSFHNHFEQWLALTEAQNCPVCQQQPMPEGMVDIIELPHSWLDAEPVDCLKGACTLTAKKHVVELYELEDNELLGLMKELQLCTKALKAVTGAVKINIEIHGNSLPHLHAHLYPRYRDDPFPDQAIDYHQKRRWYTEEGFRLFVARLRESIAENGD